MNHCNKVAPTMLHKKKYFIILFLCVLLIFHFLNNFIWLNIDNNPGGVDTNWHLVESIKFQILFRGIIHSSYPLFTKVEQVFYLFRTWPTDNWPPFIYFLSALINPNYFYLFPTRLIINFIFFILLVISTYFLGKKCFNRKVGLLAAFLVSFYPSVYAFSRQFELDFPLTGLIALCVCLLIYSDGFSKSIYSLLLGLCLGIASLVKLQIMFFLFVPLIYSVLGIFSKDTQGRCKVLLNLVLSLALAYSISSLYWSVKAKYLLVNFYQHAFSLYPFFKGETPPILGLEKIPILSLKNLAFYPRYLLNHMSLPLLILFIFGLVKFLRIKIMWKNFFVLSLLVPYFIFTFLSVKWARYILPLLVFVAIISAWLIDNLKFKYKYLKAIVMAGLTIYCAGVYFLTSWSNRPWPHQLFSLPTEAPISHTPDSNNYLVKVVKSELVPRIQKQQKADGQIILGFTEPTICVVVQLYLCLQDSILNNKINIRRLNIHDSNEGVFNNLRYIIMTESEFVSKNELLKHYRKLMKLKECEIIILEKYEKNSLT